MHENLEFHPEAREDIERLSSEFAAVSEPVLDRFWGDLEQQMGKISAFPGVGHPDSSGFLRQNLKRYPYHILYEEVGDGARIMVVRYDRGSGLYGVDRR